MKARTVSIVGAGPGGLAAAMLLARAGLRTTLYERRACPGGRTSTFEGGGCRFDMGPTFFLYPKVLASIFRACGADLREAVPMVRLDPNYRLVFEGDLEIEPTADPRRMAEQVARIRPGDAAGLAGFFAANRRKLELVRSILESPFNGLRDTLRLPLARLAPVIRPWLSVDGELRRHFRDPRTRLAFSFQSKYLGMSPFRCPGLFTILSFLEYEFGIWHPIGGCGAVSAAMAGAAERLGAEIRLGEPVERIIVEGGRAVGVVAGGREQRSDAVVLGADFAQAMTDLVPREARRRWTDTRLASMRYSCSTFMLYLALEGRCDRLPHHTILLCRDYRGHLREIEDDHVVPTSPSIYVQNACRSDPGLAPEGMSALYVLVPVTHLHPNVDWAAEKQRFRSLALERLAHLGLEDIESRIRWERIVTPDDWQDELRVYKGAVFNLAHNLGQMLHLRPRNRLLDPAGLYLVGGGTHPGSGLPVIYESARISCRLLLQDLGLEAGWIDAAGREGEPT